MMGDERCDYCGSNIQLEKELRGVPHSVAQCREFVASANHSYRKENAELRAKVERLQKLFDTERQLSCMMAKQMNGAADAQLYGAADMVAENAKLRELLREVDALLPKHGHYDSPTGGGACAECRVMRRITEALKE